MPCGEKTFGLLICSAYSFDQPIRGIAFPSHSGTARLYSAGQDNKLIASDCQTRQGTYIPIDNVSEVGCLLNEGPWLFVGVPNAVRAWNTLSSTELYLDGPTGQVHALAIADQMLFAGTQVSLMPCFLMALFWHRSLTLQPIPLNAHLPSQGIHCLLSP